MEEKTLQDQIVKLTEQVEMLTSLAGKNVIASWEEARRDFKLKFCHFKVLDEKPIIGWGKLDYSKFDPKGSDGLHENIFTTVYFADGTEKKINYVEFINIKDLVQAKLIDGLGAERSMVEFEDGNKILVENRYLNA